MSDIKVLVFDLGNVVLNIFPERTERAFKDLGLNDFEKYYNLTSQTDVFNLLETGKITDEEFYNKLRNITGITLNNAKIKYAWNQIIGNYTAENIQFLQSIRKQYPIYLLSNTNAIHYKCYTQLLIEKYNLNGLESMFDKCFFSHEMGVRKPDVEIFDIVSKEIGVNPEEVLFFDDSYINIKAASEFGWKALHFNHKNIQEAFSSFN